MRLAKPSDAEVVASVLDGTIISGKRIGASIAWSIAAIIDSAESIACCTYGDNRSSRGEEGDVKGKSKLNRK